MISKIFILFILGTINGQETDESRHAAPLGQSSPGTLHITYMPDEEDKWQWYTCSDDTFAYNLNLVHTAKDGNHRPLHGTSYNLDGALGTCNVVPTVDVCNGVTKQSIWLDSGKYFTDSQPFTKPDTDNTGNMYVLKKYSTEIIIKDVKFGNSDIDCQLPTELIQSSDTTERYGLDYNYVGNTIFTGKMGSDDTFPLKTLHIENVKIKGSINRLLAMDGSGFRAFKLKKLVLKDTKMTGSLTDVMMTSKVEIDGRDGWTGLQELEYLDLSNVNGEGKFTGKIPLNWGPGLSNITYLNLAGNDLDGFEEGWDWSHWKFLEELDLSGNLDFQANIEDMFGKIPTLKVLKVHDTKISTNDLSSPLHVEFPKLERLSMAVSYGEFQLPTSVRQIEVYGKREPRDQHIEWECIEFSGTPVRCSRYNDQIDCPSSNGTSCDIDTTSSQNYRLNPNRDSTSSGFLNCYANLHRMPIIRYETGASPVLSPCSSTNECNAWEGTCDQDDQCMEDLVCSDTIVSAYKIPSYFQVYGGLIKPSRLLDGSSRFCIPKWIKTPSDPTSFHTVPRSTISVETAGGTVVDAADALGCEWNTKAKVWCTESTSGSQNDDNCVDSTTEGGHLTHIVVKNTMMGGDLFESLNLLDEGGLAPYL